MTRSSGNKHVTLEVLLIKETELAIFVATGDGDDDEGVWIPKSQVQEMGKAEGSLHSITIPEWLANRAGMI